MIADQLLKQHPIISSQVDRDELAVILRECEKTLSTIPGDVVELGCYVGTTSLFLARILQAQASERRLYLYDSFAGLPEKVPEDDSPAGLQFQQGELAASKKDLIKRFRQERLSLPTIKKAWFSELTAGDMPPHIAFAFLDGDYYESIQDSLRLVWPRLSAGGCIVVDDYVNEALPGARRAVDGWLKDHPAAITATKSLAIIRNT